MSAISTRNKANTIESVAIPAGAIVVGACLFGIAKGLSALANAALQSPDNQVVNNNPKALKSVAALRAESAPLKSSGIISTDLETLKARAFKQLASAPLLVANRAEFAAGVQKLNQAKTLNQFKTAQCAVFAKLESGHQQIFSGALLDAGKRAALNIGFKQLEALPSPLSSMVRFAATDARGRTIITEINAPAVGDVRIETEVVGVSDGSCNDILDAFDKALEAEGVRSQPASRKFTGGVCELSAVRDFLSGNIRAKTTEIVKTKDFAPANDVKRRQRLNQKQHGQKQK